MERRDHQLATMLEETITNLRDVATSKLDGDREKYIEAIEVAAAKIQFVKVHLEDASLGLPEEEMPAINALSISSPREGGRRPTVALDTTPVVMTSSAVETVRSTLSSPDSAAVQDGPASPPAANSKPETLLSVVQELSTDDKPDKMDTDDTDMPLPQPEPEPNPVTTTTTTSHPPAQPDIPPSATTTATTASAKPLPQRPHPVPTRSTIAHSSFSWMLEPDSTAADPTPRHLSSSSAYGFSSNASSSPNASGSNPQAAQGHQGHKKRPSSGRRNNKNAFLFGEVVSSESEGEGGVVRVREGEIFGLKSMGKLT